MATCISKVLHVLVTVVLQAPSCAILHHAYKAKTTPIQRRRPVNTAAITMIILTTGSHGRKITRSSDKCTYQSQASGKFVHTNRAIEPMSSLAALLLLRCKEAPATYVKEKNWQQQYCDYLFIPC